MKEIFVKLERKYELYMREKDRDREGREEKEEGRKKGLHLYKL